MKKPLNDIIGRIIAYIIATVVSLVIIGITVLFGAWAVLSLLDAINSILVGWSL